ncbi:MAG: AAA-associated domain-containing protein [Rhizomicrobium sp.]
MGKRFADAGLNERKEIFARALMSQVPLAALIRRVLDERASHTAPRRRFVDELEDHMTEEAAEDDAAHRGELGPVSANSSPMTTRARRSDWRIRHRGLSSPAFAGEC